MACEDIKGRIDNLNELRSDVVAQLRIERNRRERSRLLQEFKLLGQQISLEQLKLERCLLEAAGKFPLATRFTGSFDLTTTFSDAPGPFDGEIELGVLFNASRTTLGITSFPEIVVGPFDTPFGDNVTTVRMISGGAGIFNNQTGTAAVSLSLRFDHSIDIPFFEEDSTLPITLTTGSVANLQGSPLNRKTKEMTLVGRGTFNGGIMDGSSGSLRVSGKFEQLP